MSTPSCVAAARALGLAAAITSLASLAGCSGSGTPPEQPRPNRVIAQPPTSAVEAVVGESTAITITFATDDGRPASALELDATTLPAGWQGPSSSGCEPLTAGGCQLTLTWTPELAEAGRLDIGFRYRDASGASSDGRFAIDYRSRLQLAYVVEHLANRVSRCQRRSDGRMTDCTPVLTDIDHPIGIAVDGDRLYALASGIGHDDFSGGARRCRIDPRGDLQDCQATGPMIPAAASIVIDGAQVYITRFSGGIVACVRDAVGDLTDCQDTPIDTWQPHGATLADGRLIVGGIGDGGLIDEPRQCPLPGSGFLDDCVSATTGGGLSLTPMFHDGRIWLPQFDLQTPPGSDAPPHPDSGGLRVCTFDAVLGAGTCSEALPPGSIGQPYGMRWIGDHVYIAGVQQGEIVRCEVAGSVARDCTAVATGLQTPANLVFVDLTAGGASDPDTPAADAPAGQVPGRITFAQPRAGSR